MESSLNNRLLAQIRTTGRVTVYDYITQALYDPDDGYYARKIPIGRGGDYITAPEMTQVFGEVVALWMADLWQQAGSPSPFHIIELGPGRGTLMADVLRTLIALKIPFAGFTVHLVETAPLLQNLQEKALAPFGARVYWHKNFAGIPDGQGFCLIVGNEFWDALPLQQFVKLQGKWVERCVVAKGDKLAFWPETYDALVEKSPLMEPLANKIAAHLKKNGGAALFFDYGHDVEHAEGETLQALYQNRPQPPLENPGQADLTHHVDFHALKKYFEKGGLLAYGIKLQGDFLNEIGLGHRTERLCKTAKPEQQSALRIAAARLTLPAYMGRLFKVMAVASSSSLRPAGFAPPHLTASSLRIASIQHGFFTREGGVSEGGFSSLNAKTGNGDGHENVEENQRRIAGSLSFDSANLVTVRQIHSAQVIVVDGSSDRSWERECLEGDALVTTTPGLLLGICTADCVPVLLSTREGNMVAAVHAGWKGAIQGIIGATVEAMKKLGAGEIVAALGPCIWQASYEVGQEFYGEQGIRASFFKPAARASYWQFDLPAYVMHCLTQAGIKEIDPSPADTYANPKQFFSYRRRTHLKETHNGCQMSAIGIVPDYTIKGL